MANESSAFSESPRWEMFDGKIYNLPQPYSAHTDVVQNLTLIFGTYLQGKRCKVFSENTKVVFDDKNKVIPDIVILCDTDKRDKRGSIHGAPSLIVEVLSQSTAKEDLGRKKDLYEKYGVPEYWIAIPDMKLLNVYILRDGVYILDNAYTVYDDAQIDEMTEDERARIVNEFKTGIFDDLIINIKDVFAE